MCIIASVDKFIYIVADSPGFGKIILNIFLLRYYNRSHFHLKVEKNSTWVIN
jgi:hypothetical protein